MLTEMELMVKGFNKHQRQAKAFLQSKYDNKVVIEKVEINAKGKVTSVYYGTTSNSPLVTGTTPDTTYKTVEIRAVDKDGNTLPESYKKETGFVNGEPLSYVVYPEVSQITCRNNELSLDMSRLGFWCKEGEKIQHHRPTDVEGWKHFPGASTWGPSNEKKGNKFFFSSNRSNDEWWKYVDELTGNAYAYFLGKKCKASKVLKNSSRLNNYGTTMEVLGRIDLSKDYIVLANCSFNAAEDTDAATTEELATYGMCFGTNINDGKKYLLADLYAEGRSITPEQACLMAPQARAKYVNTKCLCQMFLEDGMKMLETNVKYLYGSKVAVYGNTNGRCAMIVDDDGAKLPNVAALEAGCEIIVYGLAIAKASNSRTSGQLIAKLLEKNNDAATEQLMELAAQAVNNEAVKQMNGVFYPAAGVMANTAAVLGEKALLDEGYMNGLMNTTSNFAKSAIADTKISLESVYNHAYFDDIYVVSRGYLDHILGIKDCGKFGLLVEVFSKDVLVYYADEIEAIENDDNMSDAEKNDALDELLSAFVIKYPSAGAEEYLGVRYLTLREWRQRCRNKLEELEAKLRQEVMATRMSEADKEALIDFVKWYMNNIPYGVTVYAAFNFIKNKLAGMDVDFDATLAIFNCIKAILLNKAALNVLTYIDYEDKTSRTYDSLIQELKAADLNFRK